jgi:membrane-associated phospholipid phosphatase
MRKFRTWLLLAALALRVSAAAAAGRLDVVDPEIDGNAGPRRATAMTFFKTASAVAMGTMLLDAGVREDLFPLRNSERSQHLRSFGDQAQIAGPAIGSLFLLHGIAFHNPKSRQTALLAYESFLVSGGIASALKATTGRERPSSTNHPGQFFKRSGDSSFPSGHTTTAFAAATVFSKQYPHWYVAVPAYGAAAAVGYSRLSSNKHWMSDVAAGAAIGYGVGHLLWRHADRASRKSSGMYVAPNGLGWKKEF